MSKIAAIDAGLSYHTRTLQEGRWASLFDPLIDLRDLGRVDLRQYPVLLIPCRTNGIRLSAHSDKINRYVESGGFLVVFGETRPDLFLRDVEFDPFPTNFWWWLEPGADLGVRIKDATHPLMRHLDAAALTWHIHGTLRLAEGGKEVVGWDDPEKGGPILIDSRRGNGRLIITTLDPIYHHGSGFMPATTRFLDGFLRWLAEEASALDAVQANG